MNDRLLANESVPAEVQKDMSKFEVVLEKGWNKVLIQIEHTYTDDCNASGVPVAADYDVSYLGFYARVTNSHGEALEEIEYSTTGGEAEALQIVN